VKFRVKLDKLGRGQIFIDEKDISNSCNALNLSASIGHIPSLELYLMGDVEIEGDADISIRLPNGEKFQIK